MANKMSKGNECFLVGQKYRIERKGKNGYVQTVKIIEIPKEQVLRYCVKVESLSHTDKNVIPNNRGWMDTEYLSRYGKII